MTDEDPERTLDPRRYGFPHADSFLLAEAPPCCPRCSGIWRGVDEGYCCTMCNRRWRAAECLRQLLVRTLTVDRVVATRR